MHLVQDRTKPNWAIRKSASKFSVLALLRACRHCRIRKACHWQLRNIHGTPQTLTKFNVGQSLHKNTSPCNIPRTEKVVRLNAIHTHASLVLAWTQRATTDRCALVLKDKLIRQMDAIPTPTLYPNLTRLSARRRG